MNEQSIIWNERVSMAGWANQALKLLCLICLTLGIAEAQTQPAVTSKPPIPQASLGAYDWLYHAGVVCGVGATDSAVATRPTGQCGALITFLPFLHIEAGVMGPQANQSSVSGYLSTDFWIPVMPVRRIGNLRGLPLATVGYTRMFETGHALDYGLAFAHPVDDSHSIQFEVRDYWAFSNPTQHNVVFRVVWLVGIPD